MEDMTVGELKKMFDLLPDPEDHMWNFGFCTPYLIDVASVRNLTSRESCDAVSKEVFKTVEFRIIETLSGLDWQISKI